MKKIIVLCAVMVLCACASSKNTGDKWVGKSKQNLMKAWGTPVRTFDNTTDGEILVYADQVYEKDKDHDSRMAGPLYWNYVYIYVDKSGKVVSYRNEKQNYPPQSIDSDKLSGMSLLTVK
ncbi:hypothetical protein RB619_00515 [Flavobacterium sp. LHD-80]|uniref:hypothetical protein n=1 Tax=Flavobacterium sp. LHD-80 TaxID=3071411 RepID=UPI0027DF27CD|nr:hypothetical protein [Flavobacterium sp. LHD-80]MDQ6469102.1 hypothetical protein [Flavobacterium sp. LHD-80]